MAERQKAKTSAGNNVGPFQSYQLPDKARIAGAKALAGMNSFIQTLTTCAAKANAGRRKQIAGRRKQIAGRRKQIAGRRKQIAGRKQVMEELIKICNDPECQVATLEWCVGGNNAYKSGERTYNPLLSGPGAALRGILFDFDASKISCRRLQELAQNHGHEFVERMVQTAYRTNSVIRPQLKAAYNAYYEKTKNKETKKTPTNLDGLLFNEDLRKIRNEQQGAIAEINKMDVSDDKKQILIAQSQDNAEKRFQIWLSTHKTVEEDDGVTVEVGHIKIMVNADQLDRVTLQSLNAL
jgi:hypothetical protein